ncbi:MAG: FG-GAP-like repeat-containing protein [Sandaracinaceae bacterium]
MLRRRIPNRALGAVSCRFVFGLVAALSLGCTAEFTGPPTSDDGSRLRPTCGEIAERLAITGSNQPPAEGDDCAADYCVAAGQFLVLTPAGGTGVYRWRMQGDALGGIASDSGVYAAGPLDEGGDPVEDVVVLEDANCRGDATVTIEIRPGAGISPNVVYLEPGQTVPFSPTQGAGSADRFNYIIATNRSGGSLAANGMDGAIYTAGPGLGRDVVELIDTWRGTVADAEVFVVSDAGLTVDPPAWVLPLGTSVTLPIEGGSGQYDVAVSGSAVVHEGGTSVTAMAAGQSTVTFTDRITSTSIDIPVQTVAPNEVARPFGGDTSEGHIVGGTADLGNDGDLDLVVGMVDATGAWQESGRVLIYENIDGTLSDEPVMLSGSSRDEEYGASIAMADVTGDGVLDLLVGSRRADPVRRDVGALWVYGGVEGGLVTEEPVLSFFGANSFDLFGDSVAICDFNGDGLLDIAASAPYGQDADGASDQGVIHVFLTFPGYRYISSATQLILGEVPAGDGTAAFASLRMGERLAAGDFDGDGACDLAASGRGLDADQADTGVVAIYRGVLETFEEEEDGDLRLIDRGGLTDHAVRYIGRPDGMDDNSAIGRHISMADVDGDDRADLLISRPNHDVMGENDAGAVYLFLGGDLSADPATSVDNVESADWTVEGIRSSDRVGQSAMLIDLNDDGNADVVTADYRAQLSEESELSRPGVLRVYHGGGSGPSNTPDREVEGIQNEARFGVGAAGVGDLDGDGQGELVAFAPYYDEVEDVATDRGALFLASSSGGLRELPMPFITAGQRAGRSVAWIDLDGDGLPELASGAYLADSVEHGRNSGAVRIYAGTSGGVNATPVQVLQGFAGHGGGDELGYLVAAAGDVDGDGREDLAVIAHSEDVPRDGFDDTVYEVGPGCDAQRDNPAAVYIFRGRGDGTVEPTPAYRFHGPEANARMEALAGGIDVNGDGLDDIIVGGREWDPSDRQNAGGVGVFYGRAPSADGRILVACQLDIRIDGAVAGMRLGHSVTAMGDIDADGCDDFAAGAPEFDPTEDDRNAGEVRVYFGYAPTGCASTALRTATLVGEERDAQAGRAVGGGVDVTGDGAPDLLVGADQFRNTRGEIGRVTFVRSEYILAGIGASQPLVESGLDTPFIDGRGPGEELGRAVELVEGGYAVLGGPYGNSAGRVNAGGAIGYRVGANGFGESVFQVTGESIGEGLTGLALSAVRRGARLHVAVGSPLSMVPDDPDVVEDGASYAFTLTP